MNASSSKANFELNLRNLIPATVSEFLKLESGQPNNFDHWSDEAFG